MTQVKEEQKLFSREDIDKMFDVTFLPELQKIAKKAKSTNHPDEKIEFFSVEVRLQFSDLKNPLTYSSIENSVSMHLFPVTEEALIEAKKEQEARQEKEEK